MVSISSTLNGGSVKVTTDARPWWEREIVSGMGELHGRLRGDIGRFGNGLRRMAGKGDFSVENLYSMN
ncbi:MAG: hypothetical protein AMXMBFR4_05100 [Candidatus Hydrogenedentota bacterium]